MPSKLASKSFLPDRRPPNDKIDNADFDEIYYDNKKKVECLCPKCGQKHKMTFHWIGRGTPRKYCALCKAGN